MEKIWVEKGGQEKEVTKLAFELMGPNSGWTQITGELNHGNPKPVEMPETGQKAPKNQPVQNKAIEKPEQVVESNVPGKSHEINEYAFRELVKENVTRVSMKNFLDSKKIKYKQSATDNILIGLIADHLGNDVEALKTEFGL